MGRRTVWAGVVGAMFLAACTSGTNHAAPTTTTAPAPTSLSSTVTTTLPATSVANTATTAATTTTACPKPTGSTAPFQPPPSTASSLLTSVTVTSAACADHVIFGFVVKSGGTPSCSVGYSNGPFSTDASGAPVTVRGGAFLVVHCSPAAGHDFESGRTSYTGPTRIDPSGARHVRELVETGDFEGVVSWVVGLDTKRPFGVVPETIPPGVSTITVAIS